MSKAFQCARCGLVLVGSATEEEAAAEFEDRYGVPLESVETVIVCDPCDAIIQQALRN